MKVLEYILLCPVIDTSKMLQIDEYSTKVIVGLTKFEEDYICEVIDEGLDFNVLYDVMSQGLLIDIMTFNSYSLQYYSF